MKKTLFISLLFLLFGCAFFVRFMRLSTPEHILNRDEAALAYNAFLLKEVGTDEWQRPWPVALESFGDFKLIGYPTLLVGLFSLFGYSDAVVRLPSVLAGSALVFVLAFWGVIFKFSQKLQLLLAFLLAFSPVFFFYSRVAFEANVALFFFTVSLGLALVPKSKQLLLRILSHGVILSCMLMATFTYNTPLLLLPFVMLAIPLFRGLRNWRDWLPDIVGYGLIFLIVFSQLAPLTAQKSAITIFQDETVWDSWIKYRTSLPDALESTIGSKYFYYVYLLFSNFFMSFGPRFMVLHGGNHPWHAVPNWGNMYSSVYLLGLIGVVSLIVSAKKGFRKAFARGLSTTESGRRITLLYLLCVSLVPASITVDAPHTTRSLFFFFIFCICAIVGLSDSIIWITKRFSLKREHVTRISIMWLLFAFGFSTFRYFDVYFTQYPQRQHILFRSGFDKLITAVNQKYPEESIAIVDGSGYQYIILAWYLRIPPDAFYTTVVRQLPDTIGFRYGERVTQYHFIAQENDRLPEEKLLVLWEDGKWHSKE